MEAIGLVASIALGALFLLAGASKVALGGAWVSQARDLGVPAWIAPAVPWVEITLGAVLVSQLAPVPAAIAVIVALVGFTVLIVAKLATGKRPPCACFGAWSARPIGPSQVIRNVAMVGLAALVLVAASWPE